MLSDEVTGLREAICGSDVVESDDVGSNQQSSHLTLATNLPFAKPTAALVPQEKVFEIYEHRIDTIVKVFHLPTMIRRFRERSSTSLSLRTLQSAMTLLALCSLSKNECQEQLGSEKDALVRLTEGDVEEKLGSLRWLTNTDIAVLQALVVYTVSLQPFHQ